MKTTKYVCMTCGDPVPLNQLIPHQKEKHFLEDLGYWETGDYYKMNPEYVEVFKRTVKDIPSYLLPGQVYERYIENAELISYQFKEEQKQVRDLALVAFLYSSGLRASEVGKVRKSDIEFMENFIVVKGVHILKHRKALVIKDKSMGRDGALKPFTLMLLRHYNIIRSSRKDRPLFKLNRKSIYRIVNHLTGEWPHYFRSQHISYLINYCELSTLIVAELMGISNVQTLQVYLHSSWKAHKEALNK